MTDVGSPEVQVVTNPSHTRSLSVAEVVQASYEEDRLKSPLVRNFTRNFVKKWRESQERKINKRLVVLKTEKKKRDAESKDIARVIARTIPFDLLAKEWLNDNDITADVRMYLIDNLMPTLILGVEKLLTEVGKRNLADSEGFCPDFNPINYLGQYLMRNNPKYSNFAEASPYAKGLLKVLDDLKREVFAVEDNKLAKLKADARKRRMEREKEEKARNLENLRRSMALEEQFYEWTSGWQGVLPQSVVQNMLISFTEYAKTLPEEICKGAEFSCSIGPTDTSGKLLDLRKFQEYLKVYVGNISPPAFDEFVKHLSCCAAEYRNATLRQRMRAVLKTLFMNCDHNNVGFLDRKRVLSLLWSFYEKQEEPIKSSLRNPRQWPVIEIEETEEGERNEASVTENAETKEGVSEKREHEEEKQGEEKNEEKEKQDDKKNEEEEKQDDKTKNEEEEQEGEQDDEKIEEKENEKSELDKELENLLDRDEDDKSPEPADTETSASSALPRPESVTTASKFDENSLNPPQFIHLLEKFLGDEPVKKTTDLLVRHLRSGYFESDEELLAKMNKARLEARSAKRRRQVDHLFDLWDVNGSGILELQQIKIVLNKWRTDNAQTFKEAISVFEEISSALGRRELRECIDSICRLYPDGDPFESLIAFLTTCVERSFEERKRGDARKKWLKMIDAAAQTSGAQMDPVYHAVFQVLLKDAEEHGREKVINASVCMLENNDEPELLSRGETVLRYVAATTDDIPYVLGKVLYRDIQAVSWAAVDSGKPIHVPKVANHTGVHMWNPIRKSDSEGSFIVLPIKDHEKRVIGILGIDTMADPVSKSVFITHEISFYQGVAKALSQAIQFTDIRRKTVRVAESAVSWILRRSHNVRDVNVYLVEPGIRAADGLMLRRMMTLGHDASLNQHYSNPTRLDRRDNLFKDYLFKCVESSDTITADAYGERHLAFPLRDGEGRAVAVIDISIGTLKALPPHENKEIQRMLRLLAMAHKEVAEEVAGVEKNIVLEVEKEHEDARIDVLFDRLMLLDLRENVGRLDARAFAEIKSYKDPPKVIHDILKAVLGIFYVYKADRDKFEEWTTCKQYVTQDLSHKITTYDPTAKDNTMFVDSKALAQILQQVPQHLVAKHGSLPAQYLYNWAFVCLSLIEHTAKMTENRPGKVVSPGNNSEPIVDVGRFGHRSSITDTINTATNKTLGSGDV